MITTGFDTRVKIQQIVENQLPEFVLSENPKVSEFLKQYYISQEYQGGPLDIAENLDQYINLNNLTPEVISGITSITKSISSTNDIIFVNTTKGFPKEYGLLKIDDEIITYTGITTNSFTGCVRGFSAISSYKNDLNSDELVFSSTRSSSHIKNSKVENLSALFLKEFYKKIKILLAPGFENIDFVSGLNVNNFIKEIKSFYQSKGTEESFKILFNVLYGITPKVLNLEEFLIKPSSSEFIRREILVTERISGDPNKLIGQIVKSYDDSASGPVSEVELITRNNKVYYKLQLFSGFNDKTLIEGQFEITGETKSIDSVSIGSSIITVDSTIGFSQFGTLYSGDNVISYSDKSINQFFGCSGIIKKINPRDQIRSNNIIYGYEDGKIDKKVELRVTGVLSELEDTQNVFLLSKGDVIEITSIGDKIENPSGLKTYKEEVFNSFIYNTSSRYEIESFSGNNVFLYDIPDKSSLKIGDHVDILNRNSESIVLENVIILNIISNKLILNVNITNVDQKTELSIRRKLSYSSSSGIPLKYDNITSNIQNTYIEKIGDEEFINIAANSLPDYPIGCNYKSSSLIINSSSNLDQIFQGYDEGDLTYSIISFKNNVPFNNGDAVVYTGSNKPLFNLSFGKIYYIQVLVNGTEKNKIRLYNSRSFIESNNYIKFDLSEGYVGTHTFTLESQNDKLIEPKKYLLKFPLKQNIESGKNIPTPVGSTGVLINGVEIVNYKSNDKLYFGPIENVRIYNSGKDYDVINLPKIKISSPIGVGSTAYADAVIRGSVREVIVDPNQVDLVRVVSASISGGNGSGAVLEPILEKTFREIEFDSDLSLYGGGIDKDNDSLTFLKNHNLKNGTPIVYNNNGNTSIGIGTFDGLNTDQNLYLENGETYYPEIINSRAIKLYKTISDLNSGINTVGFTTVNSGGIHKFRLLEGKNVLKNIKVLNSGSGYENRSLKVNPSGISTINDSISFINHNFNDGDLVEYQTTGSVISGLSTEKNYYVLKLDDNSFRLCDAGYVGVGAAKTDYLRKKYVNFESSGIGYQIFSYPKITLSLNVEYSGFIGTITATPIVRGNLVDCYLYENGSGYGSQIMNFHKKPSISILNGVNAQVKPIVNKGKIIAVELQNGGQNYYSTPDLVVNGNGTGAKLRAVISNGSIVKVIVINQGVNYDKNNTTVSVISAGRNAVLNCSVKPLTVNNFKRFSDEIAQEFNDNLSYGLVGYSTIREGSSFSDPTLESGHSKIIGYAYDGNPIYGPFGFSDPNDDNSTIKKLETGYVLDPSSVKSRPSIIDFEPGFFVEDYIFSNTGDLDIHNGRFAKTPEFPEGIYAYYVGVTTDTNTNTLIPKFPYFIGNFYRSSLDNTSIFDQSFDFNSSNLVRNTFPYRLNELNSGNDFIPEANDTLRQTSIINSISLGEIEEIEIKNPGENYEVNDSISIFSKTGGGSSAIVSKIKGKEIYGLETNFIKYENVVFSWLDENTVSANINPHHNFINGDSVNISGLSTSIKNLSGFKVISFSPEVTSLASSISANSTVGIVTDISIFSPISKLSVGSSIGIGTETFSVLNIFDNEKILRVRRGVSAGHSEGSLVNSLSNLITLKANCPQFDSTLNNIAYFNPTLSIGVGTISGSNTNVLFPIGNSTRLLSIPTQSIYLPNHKFKNNQKVLLSKPQSSSQLTVKDTPSGSSFNLPISGNSQYVYIINKSKDYIGLVTEVGLTTTTNGLYFTNNGSDNYQYKLESDFNQVTGVLQKVETKVSLSTYHGLSYGDKIDLVVNPSLSVGIGTSLSIKLKYNDQYEKLLFNPIGFTSTSVNISNNTINIINHKLSTGDKILYTSEDLVCSGLSSGKYFVYRNDDNSISLCETYIDTFSNPPNIVSLGSTGGNLQELSLINPQVKLFRNNNLVFDTSDSSLINSNLKIFYDSNFINEFVSVGTTNSFLIEQTGEPGVGTIFTDSNITIKYNQKIPTKLYYALEKNGTLLSKDTEVINNSEILYTNSLYNGSYNIYGIGTTTFNINLNDVPEKLSYKKSECFDLSYTTNSTNDSGPIDKIKIISSGFGYDSLPNFVGVSTISRGKNAILKSKSKSIGKINDLRIINEGFEYSSDKTLRPKGKIPTVLQLDNSSKLTSVSVLSGGRNFLSTPILELVNNYTRKKVNSGILIPVVKNNTIVEVNVVEEPLGLQSVDHTIFTTNNSNGIQVSKILSYTNGIVECELSTPPITGFLNVPFKPGDKIFVEGISKESFTDALGNTTTPGSGFNSVDHGYVFFTVTEFNNTDPAILKYDISKFTDNAGVPKTLQTNYSLIVNQKNYPIFSIEKSLAQFYDNETLFVNGLETDLTVRSSNYDILKISGEYPVKLNDLIYGKISGNSATVSAVNNFEKYFKVDYSNKRNFDWKNDFGKLNNETQVIQDSDYYQTLSYTIKSPISYEDSKDFVSRMVHPVGMKNFADMDIFSNSNVSIAATQNLLQVLDFVSEQRVDVVRNFDLVTDYEPFSNSSNAIKFRYKKLSDYIDCKTNRVLQIDDISSRFSSQEFNRDAFTEVIEYPITDFYSKFLVQVHDEDKLSYQISEVVILNNFDNTFTLNKSDLYTLEKLGDFTGEFAPSGDPVLKFIPTDPYTTNYNIKVHRESFSPNPFNIGVGFTDLGFVRLTSKTERMPRSSGIKTDIFIGLSSSFNTIYSNIFVMDEDTYEMNYFEVIGFYDSKDTHKSEFYFDTYPSIGGLSQGFIGTFGLFVENNIIKLQFTKNNNLSNILIKGKTVGFGSTSAGIGTYRFLVADQLEGTEKTSKLESKQYKGTGISTFISYNADVESSVKSLVKVGIGTTVTSLQQVLVLSDLNRVNIQQYPFVSVGSTSGIGTFGVTLNNSVVDVIFYPDPLYSSSEYTIQSFNHFMFYEIDEFNIPEELTYGTAKESFDISFYGSLNEFGKDRLDFDLNYERIPIFEKVFNPKNSSLLDLSTGVFKIKDHFFQTGEELIYTPSSTLIGVPGEPLGIGSTLVSGTTLIGDIIIGFSTITGVGSTIGISTNGTIILGSSIPDNTQIIGIGRTYTYFVGNVVSSGSSIITGVANTLALKVGSGIYSGNNISLGNITSIGINSITSSVTISEGDDRIYYSTDNNISLTLSNVATATTIRQNYITGIVTDICPEKVYTIKLSKDTFKLTGTLGQTGAGFTFTSSGSGNIHKLEMKKKLEKCLITVDGVNQYPLIRTPLQFSIKNNGNPIGSATTFITLSGISSISPRDLYQVDDEFMYINNVGLATENNGFGPITGIGTIPVIEVKRGWVGTAATTHDDNSIGRIYKGAYNIVGNRIWFTEAPDGRGNNNRLNSSLLPFAKSTFNGRVYLRQDYSTNKIYDDVSENFNGIGRTFTVKKDGENTTGIEIGSGLVFINDVFQTPDTENNAGNNYTFSENSGITSITFTSVSRPTPPYDILISEYDVNQNQVPRGGLIVSLGSTGGLGYAPLVGASVTAILNSGSIVSIGIGTSGSFGSGYTGNVSIGVTDSTGNGANVTATVGLGGTLIFNVVSGGFGYSNPEFIISDPSYQDLPIVGVSRLSVGNTTTTGIGLSITVQVGPSDSVGIGSSYFEVKSFKITKPGYGFSRGDVFEVVGLVTDSRLNYPIEPFRLVVDEIFTDSFASWQMGEFDYIDSIKPLQDGVRTRFPLYRNNELLSFEVDRNDIEASQIDFNSLLLIFVNGVMQEPNVSYTFEGGTTFRFKEPPVQTDNIAIFFYRGTRGVDSDIININETIKVGDTIKINKNNNIFGTIPQDERIVSLIQSADTTETGIYLGDGIDENNFKPLDWFKQKRDLIVNESFEYKSRDSLEALVFPSAKIIKDLSTKDNSIFVDDSTLFNYEENESTLEIQKFSALVLPHSNFSPGKITAVVDNNSTDISSLIIENGGSGYTGNSVVLKISNPKKIGIGIGTTATATVTVSAAGTLTSPITISNPGFGYTFIPQVLIPEPETIGEMLDDIQLVEGFSGIITGITTSVGTNGNPLAINFQVKFDPESIISGLLPGYPIFVFDTTVGNGITSIDNGDLNVVGIGTTFVDNIYYVHNITENNLRGLIVSNILSSTDLSGLSTSGVDICGRFSWGKLSGFKRSSNPISIGVSGYTINSGLTTFHSIQRRKYGLRDSGSLIKQFPEGSL
jgi:hypothetical protein